MKKALLIIILFLLANINIFSQINLVPNGDFEDYSSLPTQLCQWNLAVGWNNVNGNIGCGAYGSPDYFNILSFTDYGAIIPYSGNCQMGLLTFDPDINDTWREYISTQLTTSMIPGYHYKVSFYLTNGTNSIFTIACNNFGFHFSNNPLYQATYEPILVTPQIEIDTIIYFWNYWQHFIFNYTADSSYRYITIGNFRNNANTIVSPTGSTGAYYFIDKIEISPLLSIKGDLVICKGNTDTLSMCGDSIVKWADSLNPSTILATDSIITVAPNITTTYKATTAYDTAYFTVHVVNPPTINLGNDTTLCPGNGQTFELNATVIPYATYLWQDGSTNSTYDVIQQGTYWVKVSITSNCFTIDSIHVYYSSYPDVFLGNDTTLCNGDTLILNATLPNVTYQWQDGSTSPFYTVTHSGMYWVKTTNQYNCHSYNSIIISYNPTPLINLGNDTVFCKQQTFVLNATNPNSTYLWQDNSTDSIYNVSEQGTYWVTVTNQFNCSKTDSININYSPPLIVNLGNDTTLCFGKVIILDVTNPNSTYLWQDNSTDSIYNVSEQGTYWVIVTNQFNCSKTDSINVNYSPPLIVNLGNDITLCNGQTLILNATNPNSIYQWQDSTTAPTYNVSQQGTYWVTVTDNNNCKVSDTVNISYQDCTTPDIYIPNSFTPNGDGLNDIFNIKTTYIFSDYYLYIYDRWGELLFESTDINNGWDGTYKGKLVPLGVYVYQLTATIKDTGENIKRTGKVTVVR